MKFEIKNRWHGAVIFSAEAETVKQAVEAAVEARTNLRGSNLSGSQGLNKYLSTPLLMLLDQTGIIRAYKLVTGDGVGPYNGGIIYEIGHDYAVAEANISDTEQCGAGINLATLDWCIKEWREGYRILIAEFAAQDIAAIPIATDGKFRVHRCKIVGEKDLMEIGLIVKEGKNDNKKIR